MADKKNKKRQHSRTVDAKRQQEREKLASERDQAKNRWNPAGRALLYCDLVFLALAVVLENAGLISGTVNAVCTVVGVIVLLAALWLLFGPRGKGAGKGTRL